MIDVELFMLMSLVREALNCDAISTNEAASAFVDLIGAHLHEFDIFLFFLILRSLQSCHIFWLLNVLQTH